MTNERSDFDYTDESDLQSPTNRAIAAVGPKLKAIIAREETEDDKPKSRGAHGEKPRTQETSRPPQQQSSRGDLATKGAVGLLWGKCFGQSQKKTSSDDFAKEIFFAALNSRGIESKEEIPASEIDALIVYIMAWKAPGGDEDGGSRN